MKKFLTRLSIGSHGFIKNTGTFIKKHKIITTVIALVVVGACYWGYSVLATNATTTQYVLTQTTNESIQSTVTASGQVASEHQLDLSPKASGDITAVYVKSGDTVKAGQVIAQIDATDAVKSVRDARANLTSAQISYTQAITSANNSTSNSQVSLATARDSAFDTISSTQNDLTTITQGLDTLLYGKTDVEGLSGVSNINAYTSIIKNTDPSAETSRDTAISSYNEAIASYKATFALYQVASRTSSPADVQALLQSENETTTKVSQAVKDSLSFFMLVSSTVADHNLLKNPPSLPAQITTLTSYTTKISSDASSIASAKSSLTSAEQSVESNTQSISGGTPLSVQSAQLALTKAQNSLQDAEETLSDYTVTAPFAGTIGTVSLQKYDSASAGTKVATLITTQQYADLSLNETDIANVKVGQKATLTFDAIGDLTMNGTVAEVNEIGTVSQGVTTYAVKIGFDTQDDRVLPGMTANASIITASKDSALVVPSSAIKTQGTEKYVEVATVINPTISAAQNRAASTTGRQITTRMASSTGMMARNSITTRTGSFGSGGTLGEKTQTVSTDSVTIRRVPVTTGIESDTMAEVVTGLTPGEMVVTQSLNASGKTTAASKSIFNLFGARASGGTAARTTTGTTAGARPAGNATFRAGSTGAPPGGF